MKRGGRSESICGGSQLTEALGELMMGFEMSRLLQSSPECRMPYICWQEEWLVLYQYVI